MFKESTSKCNIPNNTCKTPASMLRSSISPWSPVDFSLELSSANLRAIARQTRFRCLAMLSHAGHEQPPHGLGRRHGLILVHFHDEEVCAASTLCEFDMSPMEKKQEKLRL